MKDVLYLAWKYLAYHRLKTAVLVASITLIIYLPVGLNVLVSRSSEQLRSRAASTPLLIGAKGSPLELALRSLYFESDVPPAMRYAQLKRIESEFDEIEAPESAMAIPLHVQFRTRHSPIVGTSLEYFEFRGLRLQSGRQMAMLGECVLGHTAAQLAGVEAGGTVISSPEAMFDLAGTYPLKMHVVGVLAPTNTPDDRAVFVDVKTAWVIQGLGHGHDDLSQPGAESGVLRKEGNTIVGNPSVREFNEITAENVSSFHFHGNPNDFPVTSAIVLPTAERWSTMLQGQYVGDDELVQVLEPDRVMGELLATVLTVRRYLLIAVGVIGAATLATMTLVFLLSWQLRRREMETIFKIGGSRRRIAALVSAEVLSVIAAGAIFAALLSLATIYLADSATRLLVRMT